MCKNSRRELAAETTAHYSPDDLNHQFPVCGAPTDISSDSCLSISISSKQVQLLLHYCSVLTSYFFYLISAISEEINFKNLFCICVCYDAANYKINDLIYKIRSYRLTSIIQVSIQVYIVVSDLIDLCRVPIKIQYL